MDATIQIIELIEVGIGLLVLGFFAGYVQRWVLHDPRRYRWAPLWLVGAALIAGVLTALGVTPDVAGWLAGDPPVGEKIGFVRFVIRDSAMLLAMACAMVLSTALWDGLKVLGFRKALRSIMMLAGPVAGCAAFAWLLVMLTGFGQASANVAHGTAATWAGAGLVALLGFHGGAVARALSDRGLNRLASALVLLLPTILATAIGYGLFLMTARHHHGSSAHILLGAEAGQSLTLAQAFTRWSCVYLSMILLLGCGGWIGIRTAPRPRIRERVRMPDLIPGTPLPLPPKADHETLQSHS